MENFESDIKAKDEVLVENNAQTIFDHLNELEKDKLNYSKRWFWELLQNAKDAVEDNSTVSVKVKLQDNKLIFSHTGDPFLQKDILHLIFHGSSKKNLEGKTGRFGTGFMTTHLLSRTVQISGKLESGRYFQFDLDRTGANVQEQKINLDKSYDDFLASRQSENYKIEPYNTSFVYELSEKSIELAKEGIQRLHLILPFVMAFNNKLATIEIEYDNQAKTVDRGSSLCTEVDNHKIIEQEIVADGVTTVVLIVQTNDSEIAVLLKKTENGSEVVNLQDSYPKIFFDFPLFGTEQLGCPVVINSKKFDLKAERDGIYLGPDEVEAIKENKRIIASSIEALKVIVKFLSDRKIKDVFNLFKLNVPFKYSWLDWAWLRNIYIQSIEPVLNSEFILQENKKQIKDIAVPYSKSIEINSLYSLLIEIVKDSSPPIDDVEQWINVAEGFAQLEDKEVKDYPFIVDEIKLCKIISEKGSLDVLEKSLLGSSSEEISEYDTSIKWFNKFFSLLNKQQTEFLTSNFSVVPNQEKTFIKRTLNSPFVDEIGNESIKKVIEKFGWEIRRDLIFPSIKFCSDVFQNYTLEKAITAINNLADKISDEALSESKKREPLISYLKWLVKSNKVNLIKEAFIITEKGKETGETTYVKRRLFLSQSEKLVAPSVVWNDKFSFYKELISKKFLLIDEYCTYLNHDDFLFLESQDLIFISPLIIRTSATKNDFKLLVRNADDYGRLLNDKEELSISKVQFSDIAYLTRSDDNILAKTSDSEKSAKMLLKFILKEVLNHDSLFSETERLTTAKGDVIISKSLWVSRLRDTQWIPATLADNEKQSNSERPSVANITELIKDDAEIKEAIKTKNATILFNLLGLSVADIIRNSLESEEEKLNWDLTFSQLLTHGGIKPELAVEMLSDPNLQKVYLDRKERSERIKSNQNIGYLFEAIFREIFKSEDYLNAGFSIERKPIGSDFSLTYSGLSHNDNLDDQDILSEEEKEIYFKVGSVLIELKATGKDIAELTPTQAELASRNSNSYVLAVLPLQNYDVNIESVKKHTRFIVDIGRPLQERFKDFQFYSQTKVISTKDQKDIRLNIEDGNVRYQVKSEVWENANAKDFLEFVKWMKVRV